MCAYISYVSVYACVCLWIPYTCRCGHRCPIFLLSTSVWGPRDGGSWPQITSRWTETVPKWKGVHRGKAFFLTPNSFFLRFHPGKAAPGNRRAYVFLFTLCGGNPASAQEFELLVTPSLSVLGSLVSGLRVADLTGLWCFSSRQHCRTGFVQERCAVASWCRLVAAGVPGAGRGHRCSSQHRRHQWLPDAWGS